LAAQLLLQQCHFKALERPKQQKRAEPGWLRGDIRV